MLGFFFRHYDPWIDRYVIYDDGSTDGSLDILRAHPKVDLRSLERVDPDSFVRSHTWMQEHAWKESRGKADWVVITAVDEHLWVRGRDMRSYLHELRTAGVSCVPALGFDMNSETFPQDEGLLVEAVTRGRSRKFFNKLSIFDPTAIVETRFIEGRHRADPTGRVVVPGEDELILWHFKHLGFERNAARHAAQAARLGSKDLENGWGHRYSWPRGRLAWQWDEMRATSSNLAASDAPPAFICERPLWWRPAQRLADVLPQRAITVSPLPVMAPRVSVVVKCYNHEAYVRHSIQSVLNQSFQDFEIVVTDDASSDDTPQIVRSFADRRISLVELPLNRGISGAMNDVISRARGEYVAILNSDDWSFGDRLETQVTFLDTHQNVGVLFGLPVFVDDRGEPTAGFNDFTVPLNFPDFTRATWLRQFFFRGNCLCAPTAMVRRDVYQRVGGYDIRLTNLQDLDFWIRVVLAGFDLHVENRAVTAFRVRDGQRNMSAPRSDTMLRGTFELQQILRHFEAIDPTILGDNQKMTSASRSLQLARLALSVEDPAHHAFALQTLYDHAKQPDDINWLRELTGSVDVHGHAISLELSHRVEEHARQAESWCGQLDEALRCAEKWRSRAEMLDQARQNLEADLARVRGSRSWRYTEAFRRMLMAVRRSGLNWY